MVPTFNELNRTVRLAVTFFAVALTHFFYIESVRAQQSVNLPDVNLPDCGRPECIQSLHFEVVHSVTFMPNFPLPVPGLMPPIHVGPECVVPQQRTVNVCTPGEVLHYDINVDAAGLDRSPELRVDSRPEATCIRLTIIAYPNHSNPLTPDGPYPCEARAWQKVDIIVRYSPIKPVP
jgi:hypothetical protein